MSKEKTTIVVIKRPIIKSGGHHGGAWKVAYADFVTAMMAFFLLMWLLSATSQDQRKGIADFFNPRMPISPNSAGGMGLFGGDSVFSQNKLARSGLGGSGQRDSRGTKKTEIAQAATSDNVWSQGAARTEKVGTPGGVKDTGTDAASSSKVAAVQAETEKRLREAAPDLAKHVRFKMTDEGLRIEITDQDGVPMFASGSAQPTAAMERIVSIVSTVLNDTENPISITGHTDAVQFSGQSGQSNWDLSAERAAASRRLLSTFGVDQARIRKIEGRADIEPLVAENPNDARNRRIAIVLLRGKTAATSNAVAPQ